MENSEKKTNKMLIQVTQEVTDKLKDIQKQIKARTGAILPLAKIVSIYLEANTDKINVEL